MAKDQEINHKLSNSVHPYLAQNAIRHGGFIFFCFQLGLGLNSLPGSCEQAAPADLNP